MQGNQRTEADPAAPHGDEPAEKHHSPTERSLDRCNRWLALGANLGVLLGRVILNFNMEKIGLLSARRLDGMTLPCQAGELRIRLEVESLLPDSKDGPP